MGVKPEATARGSDLPKETIGSGRAASKEGPNMDIEQRIQALEQKVYKAQMVAGIALGLSMVVALYAFVQVMSN